MRRVIVILFIYLLLVFGGTVLAGFYWDPPQIELLEKYRASFLFERGLLFFFNILPAVVSGAFLLGWSFAFGRQSQNIHIRYSSAIYAWYRKVLLLGIFCVAITVFGQELGEPVLRQRQLRARQQTAFYNDYIQLAQRYSKEGNHSLTLIYADQALALVPDSQEASRLFAAAELGFAGAAADTETAAPVPQAPETQTGITGASAIELLQQSKTAAENGDWFNAHYCAVLAQNLSEPNAQIEFDAQQAAADAWNKLGEPIGQHDKEAEALYAEKRRGYNALINGDYLESYYVYAGLIQKYPDDPDITYFFDIAKTKADTQYFFIDEARSVRMSDILRNVCFSIPEKNNGQYVIYIGGMASVHSSGNMALYLQNLAVSYFDWQRKLRFCFSVPYAKMLAFPVSGFDPSVADMIGVRELDMTVPYLLLNSIDRSSGVIVTEPAYYEGAPENPSSYMILPVAYDDFILAAHASSGREYLSLDQLVSFAPRASAFGYSDELYTMSLIQRILGPFWLLIFLFFCASASWNYRIRKVQIFHTWYLFSFPLFTALLYLLQNLGGYALTLISFTCIAWLGPYIAMAALSVLTLICLILSSALFVRNKSH